MKAYVICQKITDYDLIGEYVREIKQLPYFFKTSKDAISFSRTNNLTNDYCFIKQILI